ncbi:NAD(P)-dependent oxidoreductase [Pikeienuella sp. HZG-20]|uniref:NAD(P)-dependent oxidoreductase n=1 Tax=Paludibacillus litoralis TaxID=3133267 RepID=UPI0030ED5056
MTERKLRLGFVGLGIMGAPMVRRLLSQGFDVTVWNLEPERAAEVTPHGAVWAESPAEVWAASDIQLLCVLHGAAVEACCFGDNGFVKAKGGADLVIDFSTVPPGKTVEIATRFKEAHGANWIDSPVSGGPGAAEDGGLTAMLGGDEADIERARPVLNALTQNATRMGPLGAGQATKTLNQAIVGVNFVMLAEMLALAKKSGIDASLLPAALAGGMADSVALKRIYTQMQAEDFDPPKAYARQMAKDLRAVSAYMEEKELSLPFIEHSISAYLEFAEGNEMKDAASISQFVAKRGSGAA